MRLEFTLVPEWPPLAWLALCRRSSSNIMIFHGSRVEVTDDWFCEAVWAGTYGSGDFDQTDIVAGSGGQLRGQHIVFVSSGSTLDRLNSFEDRECARISNSLPCLLSMIEADLDSSYPGYLQVFDSIEEGLGEYKRFLRIPSGRVQLVYYDNLVWNGHSLAIQSKPAINRDFSSFSKYRAFLELSLQSFSENLSSKERKHPYRLLSTASSGYDSAMITTLAKQAGCKEVLCFDKARGGDPDSGETLAKYLGLTAIIIQQNGWRQFTLAEVPFIAGDGYGEEVFFKSAEPYLSGRVLLTGFCGDKIWSKHSESIRENDFLVDRGGLSLTEYRLIVGFIHCPLPFWGSRQNKDVHTLTGLVEMIPWDVPGFYSRPICRRIVEEAGVPRELFGIKKKAAAVLLDRCNDFLSPASAEDYICWLRMNRNEWIRRGRVPPLLSLRVETLLRSAADIIRDYVRDKRGLWRLEALLMERPKYLRRYKFPWAIAHTKKLYRTSLLNGLGKD